MDFFRKLLNRNMTKRQVYIGGILAMVLGTLVANGLVALTRMVLGIG